MKLLLSALFVALAVPALAADKRTAPQPQTPYAQCRAQGGTFAQCRDLARKPGVGKALEDLGRTTNAIVKPHRPAPVTPPKAFDPNRR